MVSILPGGGVEISYGDTGGLTIQFSGDVPPNNTIALVSLKKTTEDADALWEKRLSVMEGALSVRLESADTAFPPGRYYWDVRLLWGGEVITPVPPRPFTIMEVVGNV